tara:strand:- start:252 stop:1172 length:921 start_codon:yes stop_codon:yes gene_type:complete
MFSVIFPGQGSQTVGMGKDFYIKYDRVKKLFNQADEVLKFPISDLILNGPKDKLDLTENTQPAIFLISYSIFDVIKNEHGINLNNAKYFAGHSLGEYSAIAASDVINFEEALKILKIRGRSMQTAVPRGVGGMLAILGSEIEKVESVITKSNCEIANDNSNGQIVVSGNLKDLDDLILKLKQLNIKNIKLPVSAPFHCKLMSKATEIMKLELDKINFKESKNILISNVTAKEISQPAEIKSLLIKQIENRVRWRESVKYMIGEGTKQFIEIGPGKVLSGLIKRIDKNIKISAINNEEDISKIEIND